MCGSIHSMYMCVSVSTKVHAGPCLWPDCQLSARHYSSVQGPHRNASAKMLPKPLCGEGRPVYSEDAHECSTRWMTSRFTILDFGTNIAVFFLSHKPMITVYRPTLKMAFHVLSNAPSSRSRSSQPLKYKIQGGRNWVRSVANSYSGRKRQKGRIGRILPQYMGIYGVLMYCLCLLVK